MVSNQSVLVVGSTGHQGGATARTLLRAGVPVRALVRDPESSKARDIASLGASLIRGDLEDVASLKAACEGVRAVFSVQSPEMTDLMGEGEVRRGRNLVAASLDVGVEQFVHTSVSGAAQVDLANLDITRWGDFVGHYWRSKIGLEELVKTAGFSSWTIIRPAAFMENLVRPSFYFADFISDRLLIATDPDHEWAFVAVDDIGSAAAAAFADPKRFDRVELELAGDLLTYRRAAEILSRELGTTITPPPGPEQARAQGLLPEAASAQEFQQTLPLVARPDIARSMGVATTSFEQWAASTFSAPE